VPVVTERCALHAVKLATSLAMVTASGDRNLETRPALGRQGYEWFAAALVDGIRVR